MDTYTIQLEIKSLVTKEVKKITIETGQVKAVESLLDLGMRHEEQIRILVSSINDTPRSRATRYLKKFQLLLLEGFIRRFA